MTCTCFCHPHTQWAPDQAPLADQRNSHPICSCVCCGSAKAKACSISGCEGEGRWKVTARVAADIHDQPVTIDLLLCDVCYDKIKIPLRGVSLVTTHVDIGRPDPPSLACGEISPQFEGQQFYGTCMCTKPRGHLDNHEGVFDGDVRRWR